MIVAALVLPLVGAVLGLLRLTPLQALPGLARPAIAVGVAALGVVALWAILGRPAGPVELGSGPFAPLHHHRMDALGAGFALVFAVTLALGLFAAPRREGRRADAPVAEEVALGLFACGGAAVLCAAEVRTLALGWGVLSVATIALRAVARGTRDIRRSPAWETGTAALALLGAAGLVALTPTSDTRFLAARTHADAGLGAPWWALCAVALSALGHLGLLHPSRGRFGRRASSPPHLATLLEGAAPLPAIALLVRVLFDLSAPHAGVGAVLLVAGSVGALRFGAGALLADAPGRAASLLARGNLGVALVWLGAAVVARARGAGDVAGLGLCAATLHALVHALAVSTLRLGLTPLGTASAQVGAGLGRLVPRAAGLAGALLFVLLPIPGSPTFPAAWLGVHALLGLARTPIALDRAGAVVALAAVAVAGALIALAALRLWVGTFGGSTRLGPAQPRPADLGAGEARVLWAPAAVLMLVGLAPSAATLAGGLPGEVAAAAANGPVTKLPDPEWAWLLASAGGGSRTAPALLVAAAALAGALTALALRRAAGRETVRRVPTPHPPPEGARTLASPFQAHLTRSAAFGSALLRPAPDVGAALRVLRRRVASRLARADLGRAGAWLWLLAIVALLVLHAPMGAQP